MIEWGKIHKALERDNSELMWIRTQEEDIIVHRAWAIIKKKGIPKRGMEVLGKYFDRVPRVGEGIKIEYDVGQFRKRVMREEECASVLWAINDVEPGEEKAELIGVEERNTGNAGELVVAVYRTKEGEKIYLDKRYLNIVGLPIQVALDKTGYTFKAMSVEGRTARVIVLPIKIY